MQPGSQRKNVHTGQSGNYTSGFYHNGMDVMAAYGSHVYAVADGYIDVVSPNGWTLGGTTNFGLIIRSTSPMAGEFRAVYGHIERSTSPYKETSSVGTFVQAGQYLGSVGSWSNGNHLHFGVWVGNGSIPINGTTHGYGRIDIATYWPSNSYWPPRLGWVDPIQFIEANCPPGAAQSCMNNSDMNMAFYEMKMGMIGKFDPALVPYPNDLRWVWHDQNYNYYRSWFFKVVNGNYTWYEADAAVGKVNKSWRWWSYYNNGVHQGWREAVVIP
jgi:hypothetical protein